MADETFIAVNLADLTTIPQFVAECLFAGLPRKAVLKLDREAVDGAYLVFGIPEDRADPMLKVLSDMKSRHAGAGIRARLLSPKQAERSRDGMEDRLTRKFIGTPDMLLSEIREGGD